MEVKINREIRNYTESMFFGLSMRQFIFSVLACGVAVGLYFFSSLCGDIFSFYCKSASIGLLADAVLTKPHVGCELSDYSDVFWNRERLSGQLKKADAVTIAYALSHLKEL